MQTFCPCTIAKARNNIMVAANIDTGKGHRAYALRKRGRAWGEVTESLGYASDLSAFQSARRHAAKNDLPWPLKAPKKARRNPEGDKAEDNPWIRSNGRSQRRKLALRAEDEAVLQKALKKRKHKPKRPPAIAVWDSRAHAAFVARSRMGPDRSEEAMRRFYAFVESADIGWFVDMYLPPTMPSRRRSKIAKKASKSPHFEAVTSQGGGTQIQLGRFKSKEIATGKAKSVFGKGAPSPEHRNYNDW